MILGLAMGYRDEEIAAAIGVSLPTLRKYYFSELQRRDMQRLRVDLRMVETLAVQAESGNVAAVRELGKAMERRDRKIAEERLKQIPEAQKAGKKESARMEAKRAAAGDDLLRPGFGRVN